MLLDDLKNINEELAYTIELYPNYSNVTFYDDGSIASRSQIRPTVQVPNFTFEDTLTLVSHQKTPSGSSAFILRSETSDTDFMMYPDDFVEMLKNIDFDGVTFETIWTFKKKGPSLGLIAT